MSLNIDTILDRGDFQIPFFSDFILNKYNDIKDIDHESACKIEARVFTPSFLLNILDNEKTFLQKRLFTTVPHTFFAPIMDEVIKHYDNESLPKRRTQVRAIIKTNAPDLFLTRLKKEIEQQISQEPVTGSTFDWHDNFDDLPEDLRHEYFDRTHTLFLKAQESLEESHRFQRIVSNQLHAALVLDRPEAIPLAKQYLELLIQTDEDNDPHKDDDGNGNKNEIRYKNIYFDFRRALTLERFMTEFHYELDLFFELKKGKLTTSPALADPLYQKAWPCSRLIDIYDTLIQAETIDETAVITELLDSIHEPLLSTLIKTLLQDEALMVLLKSHHLHDAVAAVFVSIIWQFHRKEETQIESAHFSNAAPSDLLKFITINSKHLPCVDYLKLRLSTMPAHDMASLLCTAMDKASNNLNRADDETHAVLNIMELMIHFKHPTFLPKLAHILLHDFKNFDDPIMNKIILALANYGDAAIDYLDSEQEESPKSHRLETLELIKKIGTKRAEEFLIKHFDWLVDVFKADTLDVCHYLVSEKALEFLKHKVGKKQKGIDELYIIVKTFKGEANAETQSLLEQLPYPGDSISTVMDMLNSNVAQSVINLALKCSNCGDVSSYDCRDIIVSPKGGPYVAEELTCITCGKISEFTITQSGRMDVTMEMLRLTALKGLDNTEDSPFTGAVRMLITSTMGKEMSVGDGIALYKELISKNPKNPDNYIGLGNVYKFLGQHTFGEEQYKKAIENDPVYIEAYFGLAEILKNEGNYDTALEWLEKGRPYLKRPLICKDFDKTAKQTIGSYVSLHGKLLKLAHSKLPSITLSEYNVAGKRINKIGRNKIGRNETCPCGSGKKYKKCCMIKK